MADWRDEEERFDVILIEQGPTKISLLKVVRETLGLGTAEAKDFIENLPQVVKADLSHEEAGSLRDRLERAGGSVRLRSRDT
jgi:large subunit ribosomal protein L7/L12